MLIHPFVGLLMDVWIWPKGEERDREDITNDVQYYTQNQIIKRIKRIKCENGNISPAVQIIFKEPILSEIGLE
jgi:hypothetical protein